MHEAFVYSWRNIITNQLYIGWHKGDVNDGYICSSKIVLQEYKNNPTIFERYIISRGTRDQMVSLEATLLKAVDAKNNNDYYNQHNGNGKFTLKFHSEEAKLKIGNGNRGNKRPDVIARNKSEFGNGRTEEHRRKLSERASTYVGDKNPMYGRNHSLESRKKMSDSSIGKGKGIPKSTEHNLKNSIAMKELWRKRKELKNAS